MQIIKSSSSLSRRDFIRQAACAAVGTAAMTSAIRDLRYMNAAVAQSNINDYKALVCIFLAGGNDSNNLIIPTIQTEYDSYKTARTNVLAIPQASILPISPLNFDGHNYGFHPCCSQLQSLFGTGKLAVLFNTGTLAYPLTKAQYSSTPSKRPPQLFSHADQVTQWQTSIPDQPPVTGWGGRCADFLNASNPSTAISLSVTLAGANTFEVGGQVSEYAVSTGGAIQLGNNISGTRLTALTNIFNLPYSNMQAKAFADTAYHSIVTGQTLNNTIAPTADTVVNGVTQQFFTTPFPGSGTFQVTTPTSGVKFNSSLGPQLKMIARLIEAGARSVANGGYGMKRQIFFCQIGGYDLHTGQTDFPTNGSTLTGAHANLFAELSQCMNAFQAAMDQIGGMPTHSDLNFAQRVTAFTCSDFGRTFPANASGSDHGWGSHHLIMGGAVRGQKTYGTFPTLAVGGPDDTNTGRWIPTTACDQFFATLASWFGVDSGNLAEVFPNLGRFSSSNLGFI